MERLPIVEGVMKRLRNVKCVLFGCRHRNVSRVFAIRGRTYQVCWKCGVRFSNSWRRWSIVRRTPAVRVLRGDTSAPDEALHGRVHLTSRT